MPDRILVAVPTYGQNDSRFTTTAFMLAKLRGTDLMQVRRSMPDIARNSLAEQALKLKYDFVFFIDDDMVISDEHPAGLLDKLVQAMKADPAIMVIGPRAYQRHPPFTPCVYIRGADAYDPMTMSGGGIIPVDAIHFAATLVRPEVFLKIPRPWFEFKTMNGRRYGEDVSFAAKIRAADLRICCHTDLQVQHLSDPSLIDEDAYRAYRDVQRPVLDVPKLG